ncbi:hypothetical protein DENSPDRAFT_227085 [Dentipellis sp. KUC8613]|nr:hypothetical protein DENSPDRAFT_227085 [Dentipellis sp. KUC8613]
MLVMPEIQLTTVFNFSEAVLCIRKCGVLTLLQTIFEAWSRLNSTPATSIQTAPVHNSAHCPDYIKSIASLQPPANNHLVFIVVPLSTPSDSIHSDMSDEHSTSCNSSVTNFLPLHAKERYFELDGDMAGQFLGPMPVREFLDEFLPKQSTPRPTDISSVEFESETKFAKAIMDANICPDFEFHNTAGTRDKTFPDAFKPNISVIPKRSDASEPPNTNWTNIELFIDCKPYLTDPFKDPDFVCPAARQKHQFLKYSKNAKENRGRMISYAGAQLTMQFRRFCFSISIIEDEEARFMRWDRGGAIVSERFNFIEDEDLFFEFLWRFNHLTPEERGLDTSASQPTAEEVAIAIEAKIFATGDQVHKVHIKNDADGADHYYLVSTPTKYGPGVCGRATRGYVAMDLQKKDRVWLKDSWRIDAEDVPKEYEIYEKLQKNKVPNILECRCGGDIAEQKTRTHEFQDSAWHCGPHRITSHYHYRLALQLVVGRPIRKYSSTKELCIVVLDALIALGEAYSRAKILHRDVSGGNIMITEKGRGILIDWDLSRDVAAASPAQGQLRMGTWRFMSIALLQEESTKTMHEHSDDLESTFWLLVFNILRYQPSIAKVVRRLDGKLKEVFDSLRRHEDGQEYGGEGKTAFLDMRKVSSTNLKSAFHPPLAGLLMDLLRIVHMVYSESPLVTEEMKKEARESLSNINAIRDIFQKRLAEGVWPEDDGAIDLWATTSSRKLGSVAAKRTVQMARLEKAAIRKLSAFVPRPKSPTAATVTLRCRLCTAIVITYNYMIPSLHVDEQIYCTFSVTSSTVSNEDIVHPNHDTPIFPRARMINQLSLTDLMGNRWFMRRQSCTSRAGV